MPVVGAEAKGFDVIKDSREYDKSRSALDISRHAVRNGRQKQQD